MTRSRILARLPLAFPFAAVALACSGRTEPATPAAPKIVAPSGSSVELYFPLEEGRIYHYVTSEAGEPGMLVAKVHRTDAAHGELRLSNATKRFVFSPDGVAYESGAFILKGPIVIGTSWPGEHGGTTRITNVHATPKVAAGTYASCVETIEEGGHPPGSRYVTTFCPGVGMVALEVQATGGAAKAELKSYGPPVTIE